MIITSSPHARGKQSTGQIMRQVMVATLPGLIALVWLFGPGPLFTVAFAIAVAIGFEAGILKLRNKPIALYLADYSAVVTALLLALALPPTAPWWLILIGVGFSIVIAKHLYGGLGMNPFNPAMVGYVVLLISFPVAMTQWLPAHHSVSLEQAWQSFLGSQVLDGVTSATPLDVVRTLAGDADALSAADTHGAFGALGWEWVNLAFLLGGLYLLARGIIKWHLPVAFLLGLACPALLAWWIDPHQYASPLFHLFSGATMLGAFFIITDPVSGATSRLGQIIFAALVGLLVWIIRSVGGYPDAVAFAVLLLNLCVPFIDYYTRTRPYGHDKPLRGVRS